MVRILTSVLKVLALGSSLFSTAMVMAEEKEAPAPSGSAQVCLAAGFSADKVSDKWIAELDNGGGSDFSRPTVHRAAGRLISSGDTRVIAEAALVEGCDLVLETDEAGRRVYYLVENAPDGPMPDTKATIELISQNVIPLTGIMFTHGELVNDSELLLLLKEEIDDLMGAHSVEAHSLPHYVCGPTCELIAAP